MGIIAVRVSLAIATSKVWRFGIGVTGSIRLGSLGGWLHVQRTSLWGAASDMVGIVNVDGGPWCRLCGTCEARSSVFRMNEGVLV